MARRLAIAAAAIAGLLTGPIVLGLAPAVAQDARVDRAIAIFAATCAAYIDRPTELRTYLAKTYQRVPADAERRLLPGGNGQIWHTPEPAQSFGVFSYDDGSCQVVADDIAIEPMRQAFRGMMAKIVKDRAANVTTNKDEAQSQNAEQSYTLLYVLQFAKTPLVTYVLRLTQTSQGERRMRMAVAITQPNR